MKWIFTIFLIVPFLFTIILFFLLHKMNVRKSKALGIAADFTTPLLIISIPILFKTFWNQPIVLIYLCILLLISMIFTYIEWRSQKEIHYRPLLKKIWRFYFLILSFTYIVLMIVGFIVWIIQYMIV